MISVLNNDKLERIFSLRMPPWQKGGLELTMGE